MDNSVDMEVKILSTMVCLFPYISNYVIQAGNIVDYSPSANVPSIAAGTTQEQEIIVSLTMVLSPAFSRDDKLIDQLSRRISAAVASTDYPNPSRTVVDSIIKSANWRVQNNSPLVCGAIGWLVSMGADRKLVLVEDNNLVRLTIDEMKEHYKLSPWATRILEQSRLVYEYFQAQTLSFAASIVGMVEEMVQGLQPVWNAELAIVQHHANIIKSNPFIGCVRSIPDNQRVSKFARLAYIGIKWHDKNLASVQDKEEFKAYNIKGVSDHINPQRDISICDAIDGLR